MSTALPQRFSGAWLRRFARTTPGIVGAIMIVVAGACAIAALVCAGQLDNRVSRSQTVLDRAEPLAYTAQQLYAALSAADTAAATAFLTAGIETSQMQAGYERALADASAALADTTAGAPDTETRTALAKISANLTAYAGLVASAEANNRQKFVVGSSYFRQASALMQNELLPSARSIFTANLTRLDDEQREIGSTPALSLGLLGLVLAVITGSSVLLGRRTNRQFNVGLLVAASLVVVAVAWIVLAGHFAGRNIEQSRTEGTARFGQLGNARIVAEQARTDEILELIAHTTVTSGEASFTEHRDQLRDLLVDGPADAAAAVTKWAAAHDNQVQDYDSGDYAGAVAQTLGTGSGGAAAQFAVIETSVRNEIERTRSTLREKVSAAHAWLAWGPTGTLVLLVLAAAAAVVGLWPRLKEFL